MFNSLRSSLDFGDLDTEIKGRPLGMRAQHLSGFAAEQMVATEVALDADVSSAASNGHHMRAYTELPGEASVHFLMNPNK